MATIEQLTARIAQTLEAGEPLPETMRAVAPGEGADVGDATHRHHLDTVGPDIAPEAIGEREQRHPVALPLDQHDGPRCAHQTIERPGEPHRKPISSRP